MVTYVGKTHGPFARRIYEHLRDINIGNLENPLRRYYALKHGYKHIQVRFQVHDHIHPHPRGGNLDQMLLRSEAKWIFNLNAMKTPGLKDHIN